MAGTITSSPGVNLVARMAACRAAVPELTATPSRAPHQLAKAFSNSETRGPVVSQPEQRASTTALMSASEISCLPYGRKGGVAWLSCSGRSGIGHGEQGLKTERVQFFGIVV